MHPRARCGGGTLAAFAPAASLPAKRLRCAPVSARASAFRGIAITSRRARSIHDARPCIGVPSRGLPAVRMAAAGAGAGAAKSVGGRRAGEDAGLDRRYGQWRARIFYSIFTGYASFYLTRNSFTYVAPVMRSALGFSLEELGIIMSVFPLAYGFCKLVAGVLADRFSTRTFMAAGLAMTGVVNILFGLQTSLVAFVALWLANGFFQAAGAPPCAKLLTQWYSRSERGTWWGFWNTSHNTGGFIIPLLAGYCARSFGWQYGMIVPGIIAIAMGAFLYNRIRDGPESLGLPPVDTYRGEDPEAAAASSSPAAAAEDEQLPLRQKLMKHVFSNPYVWLLAVSYFFVYFVRAGISSWAHVFLMDHKRVGDAAEAAFRVSGLEVGGLLGSLVSGWASDKMMRGRRIPIIVLWLLGVMASVGALWLVPAAWRYLNWLAVFAIGFFIYGPQMLVGLAGAEIVDRSAVSSTIGLLGWIAYLGAAVSGYPLTRIVTRLGWGAYFVALQGFAAAAVLLLLPMWRLGMGKKTKPAPTPAVAVEAPPVPRLVPVPVPLIGGIVQCKKCGGTGTVLRLECGPATPAQTLSCRYIDVNCPECAGGGYLTRPAPA